MEDVADLWGDDEKPKRVMYVPEENILENIFYVKQQDRANFSNEAPEDSVNFKDSIFFQYNWPEPLFSVPTVLDSMGACLVAASSPKAVVDFDMTTKGFQCLKHPSLRANLLEMGNLGRSAFNGAEDSMRKIWKEYNDKIDQNFQIAKRSIPDLDAFSGAVESGMNDVSNSLRVCADHAKAIENKFQVWLSYAYEVYTACMKQECNAADQALSNQIQIAVQHAKLIMRQDSAAEAKEVFGLLTKQAEAATNAFKKASDERPSEWNVVGHEIIGNLANYTIASLRAAIQALVLRTSPINDSISAALTVDNIKLGSKSATDPASAEIVKDITYIDLLNAIVNGADEGIDWKSASSIDDPKKSVAFISSFFEESKKTFDSLEVESASSDDVAKILDVMATVSAGILKAVNDKKRNSTPWPSKDDPTVKGWVTNFQEQYLAAIRIFATVSANNGGLTVLRYGPRVDSEFGKNIKPGDMQAKFVLESARNRRYTISKTCTAIKDNYSKALGLNTNHQEKIAEVQSTLARLTDQDITLTDIKGILVQSIKLIAQFKSRINDLVRVFTAISFAFESVFEIYMKFYVDTFHTRTDAFDSDNESVKSDSESIDFEAEIAKQSPPDPWAKWAIIDDDTLTDFTGDNASNCLLTLGTYLRLLKEIPNMWRRHEGDVQRGMKILDELAGASDSRGRQAQMQRLLGWSRDTGKSMATFYMMGQRSVTSEMDQRVWKAAALSEALQPSSDTQKVIEAAVAAQAAEMLQVLNVKNDNSPYNLVPVV